MKLGNYYVDFEHFTPSDETNLSLPMELVSFVHGKTKCTIRNADDNIVSVYVVYCSMKDQYNRRVGRKLSLTGALKFNSIISKEERKQIWNDYFKYCKK